MGERVSRETCTQVLRSMLSRGPDAELREFQWESISATVNQGRDVIVVAATGSGKSICYQLPGLVMTHFTGYRHLTVVVSPLIALMDDQVQRLNQSGSCKAVALHSGATAGAGAEQSVLAGEADFVFVSPERAEHLAPALVRARTNVALIAIDECHCVSQWGHGFRPAYQRAGTLLRTTFPAVPVVAVTATATPEVARDVAAALALRRPLTIRGAMDRPNLLYLVLPREPVSSQRYARILADYGPPAHRPPPASVPTPAPAPAPVPAPAPAPAPSLSRRGSGTRALPSFMAAASASAPTSAPAPSAARAGSTAGWTTGARARKALSPDAAALAPWLTPERCPAIIYCLTKRMAEEWATRVSHELGVPCAAFHSESAGKHEVMRDFLASRVGCVAATSAFGMGVDKADIRMTVHVSAPPSLEDFHQQTGRAGRDGKPALCLALFKAADFANARRVVRASGDGDVTGRADHAVSAVESFFVAPQCRRAGIAAHFGDPAPQCGACDVCLVASARAQGAPDHLVVDVSGFDLLTPVRQLLGAIVETRQRFGLSIVIDVLRGRHSSKVRAKLPNTGRMALFGAGAAEGPDFWKAVATLLNANDLTVAGEYGVVRLTPRGHRLLRGAAEPLKMTADMERVVRPRVLREQARARRAADEAARAAGAAAPSGPGAQPAVEAGPTAPARAPATQRPAAPSAQPQVNPAPASNPAPAPAPDNGGPGTPATQRAGTGEETHCTPERVQAFALRLKELRAKIAEQIREPTAKVLSDRDVRVLAETVPADRAALESALSARGRRGRILWNSLRRVLDEERARRRAGAAAAPRRSASAAHQARPPAAVRRVMSEPRPGAATPPTDAPPAHAGPMPGLAAAQARQSAGRIERRRSRPAMLLTASPPKRRRDAVAPAPAGDAPADISTLDTLLAAAGGDTTDRRAQSDAPLTERVLARLQCAGPMGCTLDEVVVALDADAADVERALGSLQCSCAAYMVGTRFAAL